MAGGDLTTSQVIAQLCCCCPLVGELGQPVSQIGDAGPHDRLLTGDLRQLDVVSGPAGAQRSRPPLEVAASGVHLRDRLYRGILGGLQVGKTSLQLGHPSDLVLQALAQLAETRAQGSTLVGEVPTLHLEALERFGRCGEPAVVFVQFTVAPSHVIICLAGRQFCQVE